MLDVSLCITSYFSVLILFVSCFVVLYLFWCVLCAIFEAPLDFWVIALLSQGLLFNLHLLHWLVRYRFLGRDCGDWRKNQYLVRFKWEAAAAALQQRSLLIWHVGTLFKNWVSLTCPGIYWGDCPRNIVEKPMTEKLRVISIFPWTKWNGVIF